AGASGVRDHLKIPAQFSVIGPDKPILALVGGDAELSCHLNPKRSAEHMEIKWLQSQSLNIIHLYDNGQDNNNVQMDKYQGRTELVRNDIKEGRLALRISEVRATDDGQYLCIFNEGPLSEETTLELQVAGESQVRELRIRLECSSAGWYPEPQVLWRDAREETFPSLSKALSQTADGLFGVAASVIIQEGSMGTVSCSVQNSCLSREKISAFISISG
uniref:Ig-like domain-containing protein n=1 Tax=Ornithorhynchus anatinus TaxID=9258 RepID=F7DA98_ORNAN